MLRKKLAVCLVAGMAVTVLTGCGGSPEPTDGTSGVSSDISVDDRLIKVAIINLDPDESSYRAANVRDLKEAFTKEKGYEASFVYSSKNEEQIEAAKAYIGKGVDYLLLAAADTSGWDSVLQDAKAAGTKVILFDRTIDADENLYEASVVSDMAKEGKIAVEWLKGQNLGKYEIIHIQGEMGNAAQIGRTGALEEEAKSAGWRIIEQQTAGWSAKAAERIVKDVIDSGKSFNVIYAENDNMAKGAVAALDKAKISHGVGKDVVIMSFDANTWALEELLAGRWNYNGQCNPYQSSYIIEIMDKLEMGEELEEKTVFMEEKGFEAETITNEDIEKYGI
ncbi:sugar ABC transporter substrate-binding protein [bacterium D16-51]|nr:sugar ABC transporter substrate-binding protein [bacterium D16-59]RKI58490.1 sugar ABC transporter substrate-binding protein [bacterium D16-51]